MSSRIGENEIDNMNQGMDLLGGRINYNHQNPHYQNFHSQQPFQYPYNVQMQRPPMVQEEWTFLANFEQQYGAMHPLFYACRVANALKIAQDEHKLLFMYIHSPDHPFTPGFCRETLCSELIVHFLDAKFVCWAGIADRGEGLEMGTFLRVSGFPFCVVVALATGGSLAVLQPVQQKYFDTFLFIS